jgi:hypothetical protein
MGPCQAIHFGMSALEDRLPEMRDLANIVRLEKSDEFECDSLARAPSRTQPRAAYPRRCGHRSLDRRGSLC